MNFLNINNSAENFVTPLPFQHFSGDYAMAEKISNQPTGITSANQCDAACKLNPDCELFNFKSDTNTCELFVASGKLISGIKIDTSLRSVGMSNLYSSRIAGSTPISSSSSIISADACETLCNNDASCNVYTYDPSSLNCNLFGTPVSIGNSGSSRDVITSPSITISNPRNVNGKEVNMTVVTRDIPSDKVLVMNYNNTSYVLTQSGSSTTWFVREPKRIWEPGPVSVTVSVQDTPTIVSSSISFNVPDPRYATGGTIGVVVPSGSTKRYITHTFYARNPMASENFSPVSGVPYDVIIVGGGGGGGGPSASPTNQTGIRGCGGGGGGGVLELTNQTVYNTITVTVGLGGNGGFKGNGSFGLGTNGTATTFNNSVTLYNVPGGGGGAGCIGGQAGGGFAASGGGAAHNSTSTPGSSTSSNFPGFTYGNSGAAGIDNPSSSRAFYGGGGGGAGGNASPARVLSAGNTNSIAADGGAGYLPRIDYMGTIQRFGAGGGGGLNDNWTGNTRTYKLSTGGEGGGGAGGLALGTGAGTILTSAAGGNAIGFGCGGGGAAAGGVVPSGTIVGGNGSSGIVIFRYLYEDLP